MEILSWVCFFKCLQQWTLKELKKRESMIHSTTSLHRRRRVASSLTPQDEKRNLSFDSSLVISVQTASLQSTRPVLWEINRANDIYRHTHTHTRVAMDVRLRHAVEQRDPIYSTGRKSNREKNKISTVMRSANYLTDIVSRSSSDTFRCNCNGTYANKAVVSLIVPGHSSPCR